MSTECAARGRYKMMHTAETQLGHLYLFHLPTLFLFTFAMYCSGTYKVTVCLELFTLLLIHSSQFVNSLNINVIIVHTSHKKHI